MHADPEILALLALGERVGSEDDRLHAQNCPECASEVSELRVLVSLGRSAAAEPTVSPGHGVWVRIRDELALDLTLEPAWPPTTAAMPVADPTPDAESDALTARAQLRPVEAIWSRASGQAELATDERGRRVLQINLHADLPTSGVRQAWLVHRDDPGLRQTLGIFDGVHGLWTVDHSIDLTRFSILDVSQQSTGEPGHSGQTIVRGELLLAG